MYRSSWIEESTSIKCRLFCFDLLFKVRLWLCSFSPVPVLALPVQIQPGLACREGSLGLSWFGSFQHPATPCWISPKLLLLQSIGEISSSRRKLSYLGEDLAVFFFPLVLFANTCKSWKLLLIEGVWSRQKNNVRSRFCYLLSPEGCLFPDRVS